MMNTLRTLPRDTRDTLFMLMVISWVMVPMLSYLPLWCAPLTGLVIVWRGYLAWKLQPLPPTWLRLTLLAVGVAATLITFKTLLGRDAGVTMVVMLLALKTLELRARRDAFVVFFLSFFLMLTNFFYSQSLLTATAMLLALLGLLTALVNAHMSVGKPPLLLCARVAGGMTLMGAPIMLVLFLLFPRLAPLWGMPGDAMAGRSGLSANMTVGNIASLALDDSVAMRVRFDGKAPAQGHLYFRGPVLSNFDGQKWAPLNSVQAARTASVKSTLEVQGDALAYQVTLEPNQQPWLLTLDAAAKAPNVPGRQPQMTAELQWVMEHNVTQRLRYAAVSHPQFRHGPVSATDSLQLWLNLPPGFDPRTQQWAQSLLRGAPQEHGNGRYWVDQALKHLRTGGYTYTLEPGVFGRHTADEFWFDRKMGFCEHIASSFVILMRALGVPARIVTGYQGGERNSLDDFWTVRQSDAHAWTEVWLAGQGWVRVDPTAAVAPSRIGSLRRLQAPDGAITSAIMGTVNPTLALTLRAAWDAINNRWNQSVLNYTQRNQLDLLKRLGIDAPSWEDLVYLLCAIVVTVSLLGAGASVLQRQRQDPWLRLMAATRQRLQRAGLAVPPYSTPRQLAHQLQASNLREVDKKAWRDWLLHLESLRYAHTTGGRTTLKSDLRALQRALRHLRTPH